LEIIGDASKARLIAAFLDHLFAFILMLIIVALLPGESAFIKGLLFFLVYLAYYVVLEALWSRTLGKFFQGLVIRQLDGSPCGWKAALIRSGTRIIEVNPLLLGGLPAGLAITLTKRKQRIGDILAGTVVVSVNSRWGASLSSDTAT
jgi:uncharacterized RDD family membrane protein YckC